MDKKRRYKNEKDLEINLKPCVYCFSENISVDSYNGSSFVVCSNCQARSSLQITKNLAKISWNEVFNLVRQGQIVSKKGKRRLNSEMDFC